jgi:hypothetical protein
MNYQLHRQGASLFMPPHVIPRCALAQRQGISLKCHFKEIA